MASAHDYRRRIEAILRVEKFSALKKYMSRLSREYTLLLGKRPVEHSSGPFAVFNPAPFDRTPKGSVRLNFYTTFKKAQFARQIKPVRPLYTPTWKYSAPDATIDLPMTPRGIDIEHARKELGLHAIAFITDVEPFRMVFNPADENWLSPLAVYNLSKEHTQPIKVFEPQRPDVADSSRAQFLFFALFSFTLDLIKLLLGFPEADGEHITFLYGRLFANIYKVIGEFTGALKSWEILAACSLICLMICVDVRPFFHTMYLWFKSKGTEISFTKMSKLFDPVFLWFEHYQWAITGLCLFLAFNFTFMPSYVHVVLEYNPVR